jgi:iron complex transport system ATP-binding protein
MTLCARDIALNNRLSNVSLSLDPGCITAICGPNGAGKSTLLETLAGLLRPDAGEIRLDGSGLDTLKLRERARRIGYLPQEHEVAWDVPVRSLVELGRMPHGDNSRGPVDAALRALDIEHLSHRRAQSLSGGETARVLLARVLAGEPAWILADEPLAALDLAHQAALMRLLRQAAGNGAGVVIVLHDLVQAMNNADRVVVLDKGSIAYDAPPAEALSHTAIREVWGVDVAWLEHDGKWALATR